MKIFFDSSAFAKRYILERGSEVVDQLCEEADAIALCILCPTEIVSALCRRRRENTISHDQYLLAKQALSQEIRDVDLIQLTPSVIRRSTNLLEQFPLKSNDSLHVACALEWEAELFVSADRQQITAVRKTGLKAKQL